MVQWSQPHLVKQSNKICSLHCCWISDTPLNGGWFSHPTSHPDPSPTSHTLLPLFQPKARAASLSAELAQIKDWSDTASSQRKYVKQLQFVQRTYGKEKQFIGLEGGILTYLNWKPWFLPRNRPIRRAPGAAECCSASSGSFAVRSGDPEERRESGAGDVRRFQGNSWCFLKWGYPRIDGFC